MPTPVYDDDKLKTPAPAGSHDNLNVPPEKKQSEITGLENAFNAPSAEKPSNEEAGLGAIAGGALPETDFFKQNAKKLTPGMKIGKFNVTKKQGGIAGGLIALIAALFIGLSTLGPLQFIHFAQILQAFHFSSQEYDGNSRIKKLIIYAKTGKAENTRLGYIASAQATNIDKKLAANGWSIDSKNLGAFDGFSYDPTTGEHPVKESEAAKHNEQLKAALEKEGVKNIRIESVTKTVNGQKVTRSVIKIPPDGMKYWSNRALIKTIYSGNRDVGKVVGAYEKRLLIKRAGITFNPATKLDAKYQGTVLERLKKWKEGLSKQLTGKATEPVKAGAAELPKDATNQQQAENAHQAQVDGESNAVADEAKAGKLTPGKIAGGGAAAVGFLCIVKTMADSASAASEVNRIVPLMQTGSLVVSVGSKMMDGGDVSPEVAQELSKLMSSKQNGSFMNASTLQYEQGKEGGATLPAELSPSGGQNLVSEMLANVPFLDGACKVLESTLVTVLLTALSPAQSAVMLIFNQTAGKVLFEKIINFFTTPVVDLSQAKYAGGVFGEGANVGVRLMSNETAATMAGRPLTGAEEQNLKQVVANDQAQYDETRSIADKYLNPKNYDTPVAKVIDNVQTNDVTASVASIPRSLFTTLLSPFTKKADAATSRDPSQVYYGIKKVGFAPGTLDTVDNPYTNAIEAKAILQRTGDKYINLLKECNKVDVTGIADGEQLDFTSETGTPENPAIMGEYKDAPAECSNDNDPDFFKIRAAVFDTTTMKAFSCTELDDSSSCSDISGGNDTTATATDGAVAPIPGQPGQPVQTRFGPFVFPVQATQAEIKKGGWCWDNKTVTCHGTEGYGYYASDIFNSQGHAILSATDGVVVNIKPNSPNKAGTATETLITIKANDCDDTGKNLTCIGQGTVFWYGHLMPNSATVKKGDKVKAGQQIGISGGPAQGDGEAHLHIDATNRKNDFRGACARETPDLCRALGFINIQPELYAAFNAIGTVAVNALPQGVIASLPYELHAITKLYIAGVSA